MIVTVDPTCRITSRTSSAAVLPTTTPNSEWRSFGKNEPMPVLPSSTPSNQIFVIRSTNNFVLAEQFQHPHALVFERRIIRIIGVPGPNMRIRSPFQNKRRHGEVGSGARKIIADDPLLEVEAAQP